MGGRVKLEEIAPEEFMKLFDERYSYEPETGIFRRKRQWRDYPVGSIVAPNKDGYVWFRIAGQFYFAHRAAFVIMTGKWPTELADHGNCVTTDNRWSNLREATYLQNAANRGADRRNKSGFKGVVWCDRDKSFLAYIRIGGRTRNLGSFGTASEAHAAYKRAASELFGEFARAA